MAEKEPASARPKKIKPISETKAKSYAPRQPTPTETAKDEHIASLNTVISYHIEQHRIVRIECSEIRASHAVEIGSLREAHAQEVAALRSEIRRLEPEVARLRESLANLKSNAGISAAAVAIGGTAVSAAGQFPLKYQGSVTVGGIIAILCAVVVLSLAARRSNPTMD